VLVEAFRMGFSVVCGVVGAFSRRIFGEAFDGLCCSWGGATVTDHITPGKTYYRVNWTRPYTDPFAKKTDKPIFGTDNPATKIMTYKNGPETLQKYQQEYKLAKPNAKFRD
jgi:hypothetical protein